MATVSSLSSASRENRHRKTIPTAREPAPPPPLARPPRERSRCTSCRCCGYTLTLSLNNEMTKVIGAMTTCQRPRNWKSGDVAALDDTFRNVRARRNSWSSIPEHADADPDRPSPLHVPMASRTATDIRKPAAPPDSEPKVPPISVRSALSAAEAAGTIDTKGSIPMTPLPTYDRRHAAPVTGCTSCESGRYPALRSFRNRRRPVARTVALIVCAGLIDGAVVFVWDRTTSRDLGGAVTRRRRAAGWRGTGVAVLTDRLGDLRGRLTEAGGRATALPSGCRLQRPRSWRWGPALP